MRSLLISVLVLLGIVAAADRILLALTEDKVADLIQEEGELPSAPDISIEGVPFLTQAIEGRYDSVRVGVDVQALGLPAGATADIRLREALVPLESVFSQAVSSVPVENVVGVLTFPYDYLGEQLGGATVTRDGSGLRVETTVSRLGRDFAVAATAELALLGRAVSVSASSVEGVGGELPDEVTALVFDLIQLEIPLPELPFGLAVTGLQVAGEGLQVVAEGSDIVLEVPE